MGSPGTNALAYLAALSATKEKCTNLEVSLTNGGLVRVLDAGLELVEQRIWREGKGAENDEKGIDLYDNNFTLIIVIYFYESFSTPHFK